MNRRFLRASALAAALAATTALTTSTAPIGSADAQIIRTSVTGQLVRGLGALNRIAKPEKALKRYAIVIGNKSYSHIEDLKNAENDARAVAAFLREHDFIVFDEYDVDKRRFERLLRRALLEFDGNSEVLFYFAGHGMQIGRRNYLLPTDVTLENVHDVPFETVTLDQVLSLLASRTRLQLIMLDSCRENPFANTKLATGLDATLYETGTGFAQTSTPINTLLSFSTSPGALAFDGEDGGNSPFTSAFVTAAREAPDQSITRILEDVRRRVYARTNGRQVPWESSTLVEPFLFKAKVDADEALTAKAPPPAPKEDAIVQAPVEKATPKLELPAPKEATVIAMAPTDAKTATAAEATQTDATEAATTAADETTSAIAKAAGAVKETQTATATAPREPTVTTAAPAAPTEIAAAPTATPKDAATVLAAAPATPAGVKAEAPTEVAAASATVPETKAQAPSAVAAAPAPETKAVAPGTETKAEAPTEIAALPPKTEAPPPEQPLPQEPIYVDLALGMDREMDVGELIARRIDLPEGARIRVARAPDRGALVFQADDPEERARTAEGVELANLTYDLLVQEQDVARIDPRTLVDYFDLVMETDAGARDVRVSLSAQPDACDVEAGDWLDPNGVGLARYPNQIAPEAALAACEASVAREPENGRFHYQHGRALVALRRYEEAGVAFEKARDLGHVRAWHAIGDLKAGEELATGGDKNVRVSDDALAHYAMGVEQGDAYAMHALGKQLLRYGRNKAEKEEGFELLSRAIEVGHTFAMNELGYYFLAKGTDHYQPERALEYLNASAEREDIYGYNNLGLVYANGLGGQPKDAKKALEWFLKAAAGGHPYAPVNAGRLYYQGAVDDKPDLVEAVRLYDEGLERGDGWGGANAAWIILNKPVKGLGQVDAAIRAGKTAALRGAEPASRARKLMKRMDRDALNRAAQTLLNEMGADVTVDGLYGGQTRTAIQTLAEETGVKADLSSPSARLITTATIYWRKNPFRVDLY